MLRVQVKSKQRDEWPACRGVACGKPEVLVLVDFRKKADGQRPDFYILTGEDWKNVIDATGLLQSGEGIMKDGHFEYKDGFRGLNVNPKMVQTYGEQWDKIRAMLKLKPAIHSS